MKGALSFLKAFFFLSLLLLAIRCGGSVTFNLFEKSVDIHVAAIAFLIILIIYVCGFISELINKFCSFFSGRSDYEKGIESLQIAFSGTLMKDSKLTQKHIEKAKKYLGEIPIISWIEGQWLIINKDNYAAKALFYSMCDREKNTSLGAYGLCKMAQKERSQTDAINAISAILKNYPDAMELRFQAISISLKMHDFVEAKKHIPAIKRTKKGRIVEAVIYAEEGILKSDINLAKQAFKLAPELSKNALNYAALLSRIDEHKNARKVLLESFCRTPIKEVYDAYMVCGENLTLKDKLKFAEKIAHAASSSWIVYHGFAEVALSDGMTQLAFNNFLKAYNIEQYDFIAEPLTKSAKMLGEEKDQSAIDILSSPLTTQKVRFSWKCNNCGHEDISYSAICNNCERIAEYYPVYLPAASVVFIEHI